MDSRKTIDYLIDEYRDMLRDVKDGCATVAEQDRVFKKLEEISFYTTRVLIFDKVMYK